MLMTIQRAGFGCQKPWELESDWGWTKPRGDSSPDEGWPEKLGLLMATAAKGAGRPARITTTVLRGGLKISSDLTLLLGTGLSAEVEEGKCRWDSDREEGCMVLLQGVEGAEPTSLNAGKGPSYQDNQSSGVGRDLRRGRKCKGPEWGE